MIKIYFDLDGTIYDLYNFPNWLYMLQNEESPFYDLPPLVDIKVLRKIMEKLQSRETASFEIISWLPMNASIAFEEKCTDEKINRVHDDFGTELFNNGHFLRYGTPKESAVLEPLTRKHVLIDDNLEILEQWELAGGKGIEAKNILKYLRGLL